MVMARVKADAQCLMNVKELLEAGRMKELRELCGARQREVTFVEGKPASQQMSEQSVRVGDTLKGANGNTITVLYLGRNATMVLIDIGILCGQREVPVAFPSKDDILGDWERV